MIYWHINRENKYRVRIQKEEIKMELSIVKILKTLSKIYLVLGAIGSVGIAFCMDEAVLAIGVLLGGLLSTAIVSSIIYALAYIVGAIVSIEYKIGNLEIIAATSRGETDIEEAIRKADKEIRATRGDGWKCPKCGRINTNSVTTCLCGQSKNY